MKRISFARLAFILALIITRNSGAHSPPVYAGALSAPGMNATPINIGVGVAVDVGNTGDPDFSGVSDILHGRRQLLRVDDIALTAYMFSEYDTNAKIQVDVAQTAGGNISGVHNHTLPGDYPGNSSQFATAVGRMFDLPRDVVVTLGQGIVSIADFGNRANPATWQFYPASFHGLGPSMNKAAMADFTGDGFDDVVCAYGGQLYLITANDVANIGAGIFVSAPDATSVVSGDQPGAQTIADLTTGDFDGDGTPEVAVANASGKSFSVTIFTVQVTQVQGKVTNVSFTAAGSINAGQPNDLLHLALVAGSYTGNENAVTGLPLEDLVLMYQYDLDSSTHIVNVLSLPVSAKTTPATAADSPVAFDIGWGDNYQWQASEHPFLQLSLVSDHLDFYAAPEQLVAGALDVSYLHLAVFTLDDNLNITKASELISGEGKPVSMMLAVGNFDQNMDPNNPIGLEVAVLKSELNVYPENTGAFALYLYGINTTDPVNNPYGLTQYAKRDMGQYDTQFSKPPVLMLQTGDTQGRSLLLGPPLKLTVGHAQPRVILGMPPMHVDWVTDANGNGPQVLNLSVVKGGFYSIYQTEVFTQAQSSSQSTTSWTHSVSETLTTGYRWGGVDEGSVSVQLTESAGYMHNKTVSERYDTYDADSFNAASQTGFDDNVWYNDERHNIYIYPVIGQTACPVEQPNCSEAERLPVTVMFAAPDQITQTLSSGGTMEWFQPVWEPGNLLSYPWTLAQLEAQYPSVNLLSSSTPTEFFTDGGAFTEQVTWQGQTGSTATTGATNNVWWGTSLSVSRTPPKDEGGWSGSFGIAYNGSTSMSTLNTSTTKIGQSTGIGIVKPGTFPDPDNYKYGILPFIFGSNPVSGTFQTINLDQDIQTSGILQTGFLVDLKGDAVGSWWSTAYNTPDLALNHPARWQVSTVKLDPSPPNCVRVGATSTTVSCASFNSPEFDTESDIWNSEFYWMRGLFITPADANGAGPQLSQAKAGDQVRLQARVYNYSLTDMPPGSTAVVQFYGQPWDASTNTPAAEAFLIDQVQLPPIPGHGGAQPNWMMAETTKLDTAAYSDQYLVFWLFVWMQDANGNLIEEMPGHGITDIPGTFSSIYWVPDYLQNYSNNAGLYHSVFYIAPQEAEPSARVGEGDLTIERMTVEPKRALLMEKVSVSAMLHAGELALDGVSVRFYDGDPAQGGALFDVEHVAHIRANETHQVRVPFRAETCGLHTLYVTTHPQAQTATATLNVRIKPLPVVRELIRQTKALALPRPDKRHLLDLLREARQLFRQRNVAGALHKLSEYRGLIAAMQSHVIPFEKAEVILAQVDLITSCVGLDLAQNMTNEELIEDSVTEAELAE